MSGYEISENYPNPFNPETRFSLRLNRSSDITLKIYNILGSQVDEVRLYDVPAGQTRLIWNAGTMPAGIYFYRIYGKDSQTGNESLQLVKMGKMLLVK